VSGDGVSAPPAPRSSEQAPASHAGAVVQAPPPPFFSRCVTCRPQEARPRRRDRVRPWPPGNQAMARSTIPCQLGGTSRARAAASHPPRRHLDRPLAHRARGCAPPGFRSTLTEQSSPSIARAGRTVAAFAAYFFPKGSKRNFWPPTLASAMRPPFSWVKTATPSWYLASFDAPAEAATALT
jgi:hypothetical protein